MLWAYRLLARCTVLPLLGWLWWRGRKDPDYRLRWRERLGFLPYTPARRHGVVVHCASVGEVIAARPLVEQLLTNARWGPVVLTCSTPTGSRQILHDFGQRVGHVYFPLDLAGATRRFLAHLQPRLVLLMERELWPNFLYQAQCQGVPVALVNARLSERSAAGYRRWKTLMVPALATLRLVCAEDVVTAQRFRALGVPAQRLHVTGNIKSDVRVGPDLAKTISATRLALGTRAVLVAGSTHAGEDEALLDAFQRHLQQFPQTLLVLVPRHPERFDAVAGLLEAAGLRYCRHSRGQAPGPDTQVLLGDTMGELMRWYGVADACFIGGSLVRRGGHNPLEALCQDVPVIAGPHTSNFAVIYSALREAGALPPAPDADAVFGQFQAILLDGTLADRLAASGQSVYQSMSGATARTLAQLQALLPADAQQLASPPLSARRGPDVVWADPAFFATADPRLFDLDWWRQHGSVTPRAAGRGNVHSVSDTRQDYLLRHYYRGGLMAHLSRDLFLAQALRTTRAMAEFSLLARLSAQGLPVPRACAARMRRVAGAWYRADILVLRIPDAHDVAALLHKQHALTPPEWHTLGRAMRQLHDAQVWHSDLNCHNLMLDAAGKAWIVDFDKCAVRCGDDWKQANLDRLQRSLRKELRLDASFAWREEEWQYLIAGYGTGALTFAVAPQAS